MSFLCQNLQQFLLAKKRVRNWSVWCTRSALFSAKILFEFGRWRCPLGAGTGKFLKFWIHEHYLHAILMSKSCKFSVDFEQIFKNFNWLIRILNKFFRNMLYKKNVSKPKFSQKKIFFFWFYVISIEECGNFDWIFDWQTFSAKWKFWIFWIHMHICMSYLS